jgi:hypothetical protein
MSHNNTVIGHFDDAFCNFKKIGSTCNMVVVDASKFDYKRVELGFQD